MTMFRRNVYKANDYFCCAAGMQAFQKENGFVGCTEDTSTLDNCVVNVQAKASHTMIPNFQES
jgi:hypothetical protein